jgi:ubiquitin-like modifier-activating enzyme ATG7
VLEHCTLLNAILRSSPADFAAQVVEAYRTQGHPFLLRAFNEPDFLEKLTGLDKLYEEGEAVLDSIDWEEGDSDEGF